MGLGRYVVDAVVLEGRSPTELAKSHGLSRTWIYELVTRFRAGGYEALEPRSRRPKSCPHQHGPAVEAAILELRRSLAEAGHDAGAQTIAHHLKASIDPVPAVSTIWRILSRHGLITPEPHKRPRASFIRFAAALPNELWQTDAERVASLNAVRRLCNWPALQEDRAPCAAYFSPCERFGA